MGAVKPTKLSVSKIKSRLLNVSQSSLYRLTLSVPPAVRNRLNFENLDYDNISLLCCEAALPGSSLTTHEVNNDYHGVTEKMAYRRMYDETIGLTFYVDRNYKVVELIETWMDYITGMGDKDQYKKGYVGYRMAYPQSYKNNIYLTKFERDQFSRESKLIRTTLDYTFVQAFPIALTAMPVSYEGSDALKCSASFNFIRYVTDKNTSASLQSISSILNRDPTLGANDLIGTTADFA